MASASIDLVRAVWADWERGDYSSTEWQHPDIEFVIADGPAPGAWTGIAGMREAWGGVLKAWEGFHSEAGEYRELDDERVLVLSRVSGRGRGSGLELREMQANGATLLHVRDGKVTRLVIYFDAERALAELDLGYGLEAP